METVVVYSSRSGDRLRFTLDWLFRERLQLDYTLISSEAEAKTYPFVIAYGTSVTNGISIPDKGLLWEQGIHRHEPEIGTWKDLPCIFATNDNAYTLSFDLFSSIFYLLSRYEEYYHYTPDKHDRYPATASILYRKGWLQRPIVDEWVSAFRKLLQSAAGITAPPTYFVFQPTYDIDMAYAHLHKGLGRIVGAYMRAFLKGQLQQISERTQVLKNKQKDPFDSFRWLRQLHKEYDCRPVYFVLAALKTTAFDKNIHPQHPAMMRVIKNLAKEGTIGIHPSYYSADENLLSKEKKTLEHISARIATVSRQHYIKVRTPFTQRSLLAHDIRHDYSMGYGAFLGFRAGTGSSFLWYDIEKETITALRIHPFCFMDTTAHYENRLTVSDAFARLQEMSRKLEQTGSTLITVFHNFSLGTSNEWQGWRQAYESFLQEKSNMTHHH